MTENDWGDLEALPPRKSGTSRWLWFCGGGCLVLLILALSAGWWMVDWFQEGIDTDVQWERLAEILPYDHRTEEYVLKFGQKIPLIDCEAFMFMPVGFTEQDAGDAPGAGEETREAPREEQPGEEQPGEGQGEEGEEPGESPDDGATALPRREAIFVALLYFELPDGDGDAAEDLVGNDEAERIPMLIQGLELAAYRVDGRSGPSLPGMPSNPASSVMVVLPRDDSGGQVLLTFVRQGADEPVTQAEIEEFLAPFHVGPERR